MTRLAIRLAGAVILGLSCAAAMSEEAKPPAAEPAPAEKPPTFGPPQGAPWEGLPALTDEFEGTKLDADKWHAGNPGWPGRQPGWFNPRNVTVSDGKLHITMKKESLPGLPEGYHTYTCGAVKSKVPVLYGYFEVKCKPMKSRGSSAFWFYDAARTWWTEIDVFEIGGGAPRHERVVHMNAHVFITPTEGKKHWSKGSDWAAPFNLADDYHVYALEWDKERLIYCVDGVPRRMLENTHWHQALYLNLDSETMPDWFGLPEDSELPATFSIEYVRAWKKVAEKKDGAPKAPEKPADK